MSSQDWHKKRSKELFGDEFEKVHKYLDYPAKHHGKKHRKFRHDAKAVEQVREWWGDKAAEVAEQHIADDKISTRNKILMNMALKPKTWIILILLVLFVLAMIIALISWISIGFKL